MAKRQPVNVNSDINNIVLLKQMYDRARANGQSQPVLNNIQSQANSYYATLNDPAQRQALQGMNGTQAADWYRALKYPTGTAAATTPSGGVQQASPASYDTTGIPQQPSEYDQLLGMYTNAIQGYGSSQASAAAAAKAEAERQRQATTNNLNTQLSNLSSAEQDAYAAYDRDYNLAKQDLSDSTFSDYLTARQNVANRGLSGTGIADDTNARVQMANNRNLTQLQNSVLNNKATTRQGYANQRAAIENQIASMPSLASGTQAAGSSAAAGAVDKTQLDAYANIFEKVLPYSRMTAKDEAGAQLELMKALGYAPDGTQTLEARDKADTSNRNWTELYGYDQAGNLTRQSRADADTSQRGWSQLSGQLPGGSPTLGMQELMQKQAVDQDASNRGWSQIMGYDAQGRPTFDNSKFQQQFAFDQTVAADKSNQAWTTINLNTFKTQNQVAQDWDKVKISQQNANTQRGTLDQRIKEFDDKQSQAAAKAQVSQINTLMSSSYKDANDAYADMQKLDPKKQAAAYEAAKQRYTRARQQYDIAYQASDTLMQIDINGGVNAANQSAAAKNSIVSQGLSKVSQMITQAQAIEQATDNFNVAAAGKGAYKNYYKAKRDAASNPQAYQAARSSVSQALQAQGMPAAWLEPTLELIARESSFNPRAKNPKSTASGMFQFLDGTRANYGGTSVNWSDPYQQSLKGLQYIKDRYGTPEKALAFWDKNKWY